MTASSVVNHSTDCDTAALGAYVEYLASFQSAAGREVVLLWPEARAIAHADFRPTDCMCGVIQERRLIDQLKQARRRLAILQAVHAEPGLTYLPAVRVETEVELLADLLRRTRTEQSMRRLRRVGDGS